MNNPDSDSLLYPNADDKVGQSGLSRRHLLAGGATVGATATAGYAGSQSSASEQQPTVFVFNTGDGTVSLIDPTEDSVVGTRDIGRSSSFPSNQYTPALTDQVTDPLWLNVGQSVQALEVDSLSETARIETGSGANWLEQTPDGAHVIVR